MMLMVHIYTWQRDRENHKGLLDKVLDHFVNARQRRIMSLWREGRELFKNFIHTNSTLKATRKSRLWHFKRINLWTKLKQLV